LLHKTKRDTWQVKPVTQLFFDIFGQFMNNNKVRKKVSAESFLTRFLQTLQGEEDRTLDDVMVIFSKLHELELADVANHITQPNYISLEQFEAYLVGLLLTDELPLRHRFSLIIRLMLAWTIHHS
jgi:hypothetical protein